MMFLRMNREGGRCCRASYSAEPSLNKFWLVPFILLFGMRGFGLYLEPLILCSERDAFAKRLLAVFFD